MILLRWQSKCALKNNAATIHHSSVGRTVSKRYGDDALEETRAEVFAVL
jgi:hypothetical protein